MAARAGIGFTALDNGFAAVAAVADVAAVQAICGGFDEHVIAGLTAKWMGLLPCPFTAEDTAAGYRHDISVLQAEFSLTQVLDKPVTGRIFFEQVIRDNLDIGRPDHVGRIIRKGRRPTPGRRLGLAQDWRLDRDLPRGRRLPAARLAILRCADASPPGSLGR
jgi:hypothetical protein